MNLVEAIEFSRKFRSFHPRVFKGFVEWGIWDTETDGYVVVADAKLANPQSSNRLDGYIKNHRLKIWRYKGYLLIGTLY